LRDRAGRARAGGACLQKGAAVARLGYNRAMAFARTAWIIVGAGGLALGWVVGCTAVLGIDKDYFEAPGGAGGTTSTTHHGGGGTGGTTPTGGGGSGTLPNGEPCIGNSQCEHGHCVDDVCCNNACDGVCKACTGALTGHDDGMCENIPAGEDPQNECPNEQSCDGNGHCLALDGQSCTGNSSCVNGHCPHGMCCDDPCNNDCESCEAAHTGLADGACGPVLAGQDPYNQCNGANDCDGSGSCN
jgi:hypothetical protein